VARTPDNLQTAACPPIITAAVAAAQPKEETQGAPVHIDHADIRLRTLDPRADANDIGLAIFLTCGESRQRVAFNRKDLTLKNEPSILTTKEAAELLRCTERSIQRWHRSGRLPSLKLGTNYTRFRREDVLAMLSPVERQVQPITGAVQAAA
jgi:excisionase family DNA binding protein